jgi:hypothetical protein
MKMNTNPYLSFQISNDALHTVNISTHVLCTVRKKQKLSGASQKKTLHTIYI